MRALPAVTIASLLLFGSTAASAAEWPELGAPSAVQGGGESDAALILAVEDYAFVADVAGASQNAQDWYLHLTRTRKIPSGRVKLLRDAEVTRESMLLAASAAAGSVKPGGTLWVVFIGHGAPAEDGQDGVLVGVDAQQTALSLYARSVRQKELLALLGKGAHARTVAVIDACFSGSTGAGALAKGLQPLLPVSAAMKLDVKAIVLSAGAGNQFAGPLPGADRPAFSYLVLGALRGWGDGDADGRVTATEAVTYARETIAEVVKGRVQVPELAFGDGKAVLAGGAREKGPELVAFVLERRPREEKAAPEVRKTGPTVNTGNSITTVVGDLTVDVKPREGVRLELTDPEGKSFAKPAPYKNDAAVIGRWRVVAKAEGYADETQEFEVPPDETTVAKLTMKRLGALKVTGTPVGAAVKVTGPAFAPEPSGLPWEATGLRSGMYQVEVSRPGYDTYTKDVAVEPGATGEAAVELRKKGAAGALGGETGGTGGCPAGMAFVAGGSYVLGDAKTAATVVGFCMDLTEVTVGAYTACVLARRCSAEEPRCGWFGLTGNWGEPDRTEHPINCTDWNQAAAFCKTMGKRLPTEEEWEWAARGGEKGTVYPWGDGAPASRACWNGEGNDLGKGNRKSTCKVGSHPAGASPIGIHDLSGNVWEWSSTPSGAGRVYRGGGWGSDDPSWLRAAFRGADGVGNRNLDLGFRCARTP